MWIQPVVEDLAQEAVLIKLFQKFRTDLYLHDAIGKKGNSYIKMKLKSFNEASKWLPHIVITDLDNEKCPPALIDKWVTFDLSDKLLFRIAVKEIDAWILADRIGFSSYMSVSAKYIPMNTESIVNPKEAIISLARKSKKKIMKDMIPRGTATVGPGYNIILQDFIENYWNIDSASSNNESLLRAIKQIKRFLK